MSGWQAVACIAIGVVGACALAMTGHEQIAIAIGGPIITGVFAIMIQYVRRTRKGTHGHDKEQG